MKSYLIVLLKRFACGFLFIFYVTIMFSIMMLDVTFKEGWQTGCIHLFLLIFVALTTKEVFNWMEGCLKPVDKETN